MVYVFDSRQEQDILWYSTTFTPVLESKQSLILRERGDLSLRVERPEREAGYSLQPNVKPKKDGAISTLLLWLQTEGQLLFAACTCEPSTVHADQQMEGRSMHILLLNVFCHYPQSLFLFPIA
jgi:hypothetical protein